MNLNYCAINSIEQQEDARTFEANDPFVKKERTQW